MRSRPQGGIKLGRVSGAIKYSIRYNIRYYPTRVNHNLSGLAIFQFPISVSVLAARLYVSAFNCSIHATILLYCQGLKTTRLSVNFYSVNYHIKTPKKTLHKPNSPLLLPEERGNFVHQPIFLSIQPYRIACPKGTQVTGPFTYHLH